ncbi:uncharacterized protein GWK60_J11429 [Nakaseomyces glabratus]|nr:Serine/Threonine protein kinases active-site signature [Nakaseomyces glabratus]QNG15380.1 uncharacterized protein GWK60_J11429 [Nakaseomyces glabratus]
MMGPLKNVDDKQLNVRIARTPVKTNPTASHNHYEEGKENYVVNQHHKRIDQQGQQHKRKKEKLSSLCKTPPSLIKTRGRDYHRGQFLGEGGFARCFQIKDDSGKIFAAKTVAKISIKSEKTRKKLLSEIQIHKSMSHTNIVQFIDCFEDNVNVYILLEICPNGSLMELIKKRKTITEPEVRFFMTQICGGIQYMHSNRVIHRDLKLGNIFFDEHYNLKIGDFGLAAVLANDRERKFTICGTPNYIAPEVLMGKHSGHSYEVDIWSIGVMLYALLIGKPPFQAKDVNTIYERIKQRNFAYPKDKKISQDAKYLIDDILSLNPMERPSIQEIMDYVWFRGTFPPYTLNSVMTTVPDYSHITPQESFMNFQNCLEASGLLSVHQNHMVANISERTVPTNKLHIAPAHKYSSNPYMTEYNNAGNSIGNNGYPDTVQTSASKRFHMEKFQQQEKFQPILPHSLSPGGTKNKYKEVIDLEAQRKLNDLAREARIRKARQSMARKELIPTSTNLIKSDISLRILASECQLTLNGILEAEAQKRMGGLPKSRLPSIKNPMVVTKWVDYSNKHGFSYQLSTEDIGVLFNNGSTVLRLADADEFWYITYDEREGWVASHYLLDEKPKELSRHLEVVDFFAKYMRANLSRVSNFVREEYHKDDVFLRRYTRYKEFVMFELSDGTFQFNFKDHHKLAISDGGKLVTYISPDHESETYPLVELLRIGEIPGHTDCNFESKLMLVKEGLKQKASIITVDH